MKSPLTSISLYGKTSTAVYKSGRVGKLRRGPVEFRTRPARWQGESTDGRSEVSSSDVFQCGSTRTYAPCGPLQSAVRTDRLKRSASSVKSRAAWNSLRCFRECLAVFISPAISLRSLFYRGRWSRVRRVVAACRFAHGAPT